MYIRANNNLNQNNRDTGSYFKNTVLENNKKASSDNYWLKGRV
jgi:hypothetical protein